MKRIEKRSTRDGFVVFNECRDTDDPEAKKTILFEFELNPKKTTIKTNRATRASGKAGGMTQTSFEF